MDSSVDAHQRFAQLFRAQHEHGPLLFNAFVLHVAEALHGAGKLREGIQPCLRRRRLVSQLQLLQFLAQKRHEIVNEGNFRVLAFQICKRQPVIEDALLELRPADAEHRRHCIGGNPVVPAKIIGVPAAQRALAALHHCHGQFPEDQIARHRNDPGTFLTITRPYTSPVTQSRTIFLNMIIFFQCPRRQADAFLQPSASSPAPIISEPPVRLTARCTLGLRMVWRAMEAISA